MYEAYELTIDGVLKDVDLLLSRAVTTQDLSTLVACYKEEYYEYQRQHHWSCNYALTSLIVYGAVALFFLVTCFVPLFMFLETGSMEYRFGVLPGLCIGMVLLVYVIESPRPEQLVRYWMVSIFAPSQIYTEERGRRFLFQYATHCFAMLGQLEIIHHGEVQLQDTNSTAAPTMLHEISTPADIKSQWEAARSATKVSPLFRDADLDERMEQLEDLVARLRI